MLCGAKSIMFLKYLYSSVILPTLSAKLVGFCNASSKANAAIAYMKLESEAHQGSVIFIAFETLGAVTVICYPPVSWYSPSKFLQISYKLLHQIMLPSVRLFRVPSTLACILKS